MKKLLLILLAFALVSCINQTINRGSTFLISHTFDDVWRASIMAVNDIGFTVDALDIEAGFIGASSGTHIGQKVPPRLAIFVTEFRGRVSVDCKVLQREQFIDVFGHGKRTIRRFMIALNMNLNY